MKTRFIMEQFIAEVLQQENDLIEEQSEYLFNNSDDSTNDFKNCKIVIPGYIDT